MKTSKQANFRLALRTPPFCLLHLSGSLFRFHMRKWDERPMDAIFVPLPRSAGVSDSHNSKCGCCPTIHVSVSSRAPRHFRRTNAALCVLHVQHPLQESAACASRCFHTISQQHTQRNIHFMKRPNAGPKFLPSLFPGSPGMISRDPK